MSVQSPVEPSVPAADPPALPREEAHPAEGDATLAQRALRLLHPPSPELAEKLLQGALRTRAQARAGDLAQDAAEVLNMRVQSVEEVVSALLSPEIHPNLPEGKVTSHDAPMPAKL